MSYIKNVWQSGDKVTAEKLNNIEDGIETAQEAYDKLKEDIANAGGSSGEKLSFVMDYVDGGWESDKTREDLNGKTILLQFVEESLMNVNASTIVLITEIGQYIALKGYDSRKYASFQCTLLVSNDDDGYFALRIVEGDFGDGDVDSYRIYATEL